eukprot:RCo001096
MWSMPFFVRSRFHFLWCSHGGASGDGATSPTARPPPNCASVLAALAMLLVVGNGAGPVAGAAQEAVHRPSAQHITGQWGAGSGSGSGSGRKAAETLDLSCE